jgi:hypothetical protein
MFSKRVTRSLAAGIAAITVGLGSFGVVGLSSGSSSSGTANAATFGARVVGQVSKGRQTGSGTIITRTTSDNAKAVGTVTPRS